MKKLFLYFSLLLFTGMSFVSCNDEDQGIQNQISEQDLPEAAQNFLKMYFFNYPFVKGEKDTDGGVVVYEVELEGGYEIVFNSKGDWQQVEAPGDGFIDNISFLPEVIQQFLYNNYRGYNVHEANYTGVGYKVQLINQGQRTNLYFNESGENEPAPTPNS